MKTGQRVAIAGMVVSGSLAVIKIWAGLSGHSTAVVADGLESASDVFASGLVLLGLTLAARPADQNHPYGHGRVEILVGLLIGLVLTAGGALISFSSIERLGRPREPLAAFVIWPLLISLASKTVLAACKFHYGESSRAPRWWPTRGTTPWIPSPPSPRSRRWAWPFTIRCASRTPTATAASWWASSW